MKTSVHRLLLLTALTGFACKGGSAGSAAGGATELKTDDQKTLYALGMVVGKNLSSFGLDPAELALVEAGIADTVAGKKPQVEIQTYGPKISELARKRQTLSLQKEKDKSKPFLAAAAAEPGALKLPSGLVFRSLKPGTGANPKATDKVKVHYHGTLQDSSVFDSSVQRGEPTSFQLNGVIPCWTEGVQRMKVGEKAKLTCPSEIAYGDRGHPPKIPGGAPLVFEVELLAIETTPEPPVSAPIPELTASPVPGAPPVPAAPAQR